MKNEVLICECYNTEHCIILSYDKNEDAPIVYASIHLIPDRPWHKRLWQGIKYIFGYRCHHGHFDEFIFNPEDAPKLEKVVKHLKQLKSEKPRNNRK